MAHKAHGGGEVGAVGGGEGDSGGLLGGFVSGVGLQLLLTGTFGGDFFFGGFVEVHEAKKHGCHEQHPCKSVFIHEYC